jgi:isopenicillin N synthase-like dioxygenase
MAAPADERLAADAQPLASHVVLQCATVHVVEILGRFERQGFFSLVGLRPEPSTGRAVVALRSVAAPALLHRKLTALCAAARASLPREAELRVSRSDEEALDLMRSHFGSREVVQWGADDPDDPSYAESPPLGRHCEHSEALWLDDVLGAAPGTPTSSGTAFARQLRRDGYSVLLLTHSQSRLWHEVESCASAWFAQGEEAKLDQAGAYGHIDRKFTGYRNGKFREQLEVRATEASVHPSPVGTDGSLRFAAALSLLLRSLDSIARGLLLHVACELGVSPAFFDGLCDPAPAGADSSTPAGDAVRKPLSATGAGRAPPPRLLEGAELPAALETEARRIAPAAALSAAFLNGDETWTPKLAHSLMRVCRYDAASEGVYGSNVLCEQHDDVGLLTLDACAAVPGLHLLRRSDRLWIPVEERSPRPDGALPLVVMVGDTLGRLSWGYLQPCAHRVVAPPAGERIGLPFLFRGRSDAVLNTMPAIAAARADGRQPHLAEMETVTIKELPAFDSAKSILKSWFRSTHESSKKTTG